MLNQTISNFKILEELGRGGMGVVYKARDTKLDRFVALKFLPPNFSQSAAEKRRFIHEAKAASALSHPNIGTIYDIKTAGDGQLYIVMAYYDGETLKDKIERGPLAVEDAVEIAWQVAEGLRQAHESNIIHRDIKPANILITERGEAKLVDFGLAKLLGNTLESNKSTTIGTISYMSPEQTQGAAVDHRTDIWALGVVLYEMLTGQPPFGAAYDQAVMYAIVNEEPLPLKGLRPEVPEELARVVGNALVKDPQARYASCADLLADLKKLRREDRTPLLQSLKKRLRQPRFAIPALVVIALLCLFAVRSYHLSTKVKWAQSTALPEIAGLVDDKKFGEALRLAKQAERYIPDDPQLHSMLQACSVPVSIKTTPPGAEVYYRDYLALDADWEYLGRTPVDSVRAQIGFLRWKIVKNGYEPIESAFGGWWPLKPEFSLTAIGAGPINMVHIPGGTFQLWSSDPVELREYWIDRYEVTNKDYKAFVDARGYQERRYWKEPFVMQDPTLSWEEAMARFRDRSGQPGPSTWEQGSFPQGQADHPVGGISWYEAAAYAEFVGKSLPTIYHWKKAAYGRSSINSDAVVLSNFQSEGPARVGQFQGLGGFGTYDMAGNVREWCRNQAGNGGYILGGAWKDPAYMAGAADIQTPFDRSETNGFRCVKYTTELAPKVAEAIEPPSFSRDFTRKPVDDEIFRIYKSYFLYDSTALNAVIETIDESLRHWRKETVTFDAAYGNERVIAHLFLPKNAFAPYQTVIYVPSGDAFGLRSSENLTEMTLISFVPRAGRALVLPVYKGTYERRRGWKPDDSTRAFRDLLSQQSKDLGRTIDYLQTREDIDTNRLAYMGLSYGAVQGPILTAVEQRFKASVLIYGGINLESKPVDEIAPINFAPRATTPVLLINGRYDFVYPFETSQRPLFRLLGAPEKDKRHALIPGGHITPIDEVAEETLNWLDRYLGPVQIRAQTSE